MSTHNLKPMSEVMTDLREKGYTDDFNYRDGELHNDSQKKVYQPKEITITEEYRFEGETNPEDSSILYTLETSAGEKGVLTNSYGADTNVELEEFLDKANKKDHQLH